MSARARNFGHATIVSPAARTIKYDTLTCLHCQRIMFVKPGTASTVYLIWSATHQRWLERMGAFCLTCMRPICLACEAIGRCVPWERRLEQAERRARLRREAGA